MPKPKKYYFPETPETVVVSTSTVYRFDWPNHHYGWANFTVCDATGEFSILSDWGNWSHAWNPRHLGNEGKTTLTEFLAKGDCDYIVNKLSYKSSDLKDVFDREETLKGFREYIVQERRAYELGKEEAREMWEQVEAVCDEMDPHGESDRIYYSGEWSDVFEMFEDFHEWIRYCKPTVYLILRDDLLPRFVKYLREHVLTDRRDGVLLNGHGQNKRKKGCQT